MSTREWFIAEADRLAFVDFEASGLGDGSFPTEIGWAIVQSGAVISGSRLIRPQPEWLAALAAWSPEAEKLTAISLELLDSEGVPASEAARAFSLATADRLLLSDNPAFDGFWLAMLFRAAGLSASGIKMGDSIKAIDYASKNGNITRIDSMLFELAISKDSPTRHRAEPDARRQALKWALTAGIMSP